MISFEGRPCLLGVRVQFSATRWQTDLIAYWAVGRTYDSPIPIVPKYDSNELTVIISAKRQFEDLSMNCGTETHRRIAVQRLA